MSYEKRNDEIRRNRENRRISARKNEIKKRSKSRNTNNRKPVVILTALGIMVAIVLTVLSLTVFFKAKNVVVEGDTKYSYDSIIAAASIQPEQNLILLNKPAVEKRITTALPYIGNVDIKVDLVNSTVTLTVSETTPVSAIFYGNKYILSDSSCKYLEMVETPTDCIKVYGAEVKSPKSGETLNFSQEQDRNSIKTLLEVLDKLSLKDIFAVDMTDQNNVELLYNDIQIWKIGSKSVLTNAEELEYKLKFSIKTSENENGKSGIVDVSALSTENKNEYGFFREEVINSEKFGLPPRPDDSVIVENSDVSSQETSEETSDSATDEDQETDQDYNQEEESYQEEYYDQDETQENEEDEYTDQEFTE